MEALTSIFELILTGIDEALRLNISNTRAGFSQVGRRMIVRLLTRWHPTTDAELEMGLALETHLLDNPIGTADPDVTHLRESYLRVMVEQGFERESTEAHLDQPFHMSLPLY